MLTLAIDTAANFCSACLWDDATDRVLASEERDIGRGHAEQLIETVEAVMRHAGAEYADLGRIAIAVGPGSFTGIRVGVAAARGFGLALGVPVIGVTTLAALAADALSEAPGPVTVAVSGGRGQVFMQSFDADNRPTSDPAAVEEEAAAGAIPADTALLAGNAAADLAGARGIAAVQDRATGSIATVARLSVTAPQDPKPLYLRGADAKPQQGFAVARTGTSDGSAR
ncbi:tRNA (adenosine(37)-N6)-threonylcarbamoyltransferase complex dimerization subunit type 1 TsaB [Oricola sp.]|uniref:tRNA (adenosine(37)-N6)-threonylcarbamoyltransferase complex dimerization subunit type 1 TsaB n=1 Tax=Oricola sp. TaxID=1979950 RepID=UPI0025E4CE20|nr:tRNA (adenosine(37)-N6)-threonylcarbamoyltransferase complex dimerization subunit type 1 TsaB [Oricola sp.]MCI5077896.1 tRNA (adenosine(37)-N6)-threonylcarbamoyltransferase complex dimerization subunit type 1 TsaB [Oricola sp.]